jgi:tripartite-type tricarboxylate transporter receptor subunit TctC
MKNLCTMGLLTTSLALGSTWASSVWASSATGQDAAAFYKGKQVIMMVGSSTGGGYDAYARQVARHLGRFIPGNPTLVVQNMPGAGSLNMTNYVFNVAPKDGTVLGAPQNGVPFEPLLHLLSPDGKTARFDARKMNWIGSATKDVFVPFVWHESKVKTFADLTKTPVRFGAAEPNTDNSTLAILLNRMFDAKIDVVHGYPGSSSALMLAMEQGEIDGLAGMPYTSLKARSPQFITEKKIRFLAQISMRKHPDLPDVPLLLDLVKTPEDHKALEVILSKYEMSRPYFTSPGVPPERVKALREAFNATMKDPVMLKESDKQGLEIELVTGEEVQQLVKNVYDTPPPLVQKVRDMLKADRPK